MGFFDRLDRLEEIKKKVKEKKSRPKREPRKTEVISVPTVAPIYRELDERNLVMTVWDGEYGGVKASTLLLVFGRHQLISTPSWGIL